MFKFEVTAHVSNVADKAEILAFLRSGDHTISDRHEIADELEACETEEELALSLLRFSHQLGYVDEGGYLVNATAYDMEQFQFCEIEYVHWPLSELG